jgi:hypothetical protein
MALDVCTPPLSFVGSGPRGQMTESDARSLLDELAKSGESLSIFAKKRGFKPQRLSWWKYEFAGNHGPRALRAVTLSSKHTATAPRFVPLTTAKRLTTQKTAQTAVVVPSERTYYELTLGGSMTLRIPHDFHEDSLARIVRVLRATT